MVVEDGILLDDETRRLLEASDATVEVVNCIDIAWLVSGEIDFDGIVIDIDVEADAAFAVAEKAEASGIPFLFARDDRGEGARFSGYRLCADAAELAAIAAGLFGEPRLD